MPPAPAQGRITQITDPLGNKYAYGYNANRELSTVTLPAVTGRAQVPIGYTYNTGHFLSQITDARNNIAGSTTYYPDGKLKSVTDAVNNTTQYGEPDHEGYKSRRLR